MHCGRVVRVFPRDTREKSLAAKLTYNEVISIYGAISSQKIKVGRPVAGHKTAAAASERGGGGGVESDYVGIPAAAVCLPPSPPP